MSTNREIMAECRSCFGQLTTKTFGHVSKLYCATKEHNCLTKLTFETTENVAKGICSRVFGEHTYSGDSAQLGIKSRLICCDSILEQLKTMEMRHPALAKGSSYTLAISKQFLEDIISANESGEENESSYVAESLRKLASTALTSLNKAMANNCQLTDSAFVEAKGLVALFEVASAVSEDLWEITTKELFSYDPSKLVQIALEDACSKVNLIKEHTASQVKNLTASAVNDITSMPGKLINLSMNCMPDIITKNCLTTSSLEYFSEFISTVKDLPCVSAASEGLSHFSEYLSVSWLASFDEAVSLPEINVVLVEEEDIHFIPPLPGRRHHFAVFVGQR